MIRFYSLKEEIKNDIVRNHESMVYEVVPEEYNNWNVSLNKDVQLLTYPDHISIFKAIYFDTDNVDGIMDAIDIKLNEFAYIKIW